jgi:hypothetical protein
MCTNIHKTTCENVILTYTRVTLLSPLHVTWNHVQGFTRVASQLWRTLLGSFKLLFNAFSASPVLKRINLQWQTSLILLTCVEQEWHTRYNVRFKIINKNPHKVNLVVEVGELRRGVIRVVSCSIPISIKN